VQREIDNLRNQPNDLRNDPRATTTVQPSDVDRMQLDLNRLQNEQQLKRLQADQQLLQLQKQQSANIQRTQQQTSEFTRQQQIERLQQKQKLDDIEDEVRRFNGK
jgi:N-formylglutamate amidohydrolase